MTTDPTQLQESIAGKLCDPARHVAHWPLVGIDPYCDQCYTQAAAVLPIIAAEVRKAQADALRETAQEEFQFSPNVHYQGIRVHERLVKRADRIEKGTDHD